MLCVDFDIRSVLLTRTRKVSQLEERIESLTRLITSGKAVFPLGTDSPPQSSALPTPPVSSTQDGSGQGELNTVLECGYWAGTPLSGPRARPRNETNGPFHINVPEAYEERLFKFFLVEMNQHFPFVVVPSIAATRSVRQSNPFLFRACIAAAAHCDPSLQLRLGEDFLRTIGERMLIHSEKSLDLLQGLLVLVAW